MRGSEVNATMAGASGWLGRRVLAPLRRATSGMRRARVATGMWWAEALLAVPGFAAFVGQAWLAGPAREVPVPRSNLALAAQAALDEIVLGLAKLGRRPQPPEVFARIEDEVAGALALYEREAWLDDPGSFFAPPPPLTAPRLVPARLGSLTYERCTFTSGYEPHPEDPARERWLGYEANRTAHAWVLRHEEPRPWLVCLHGAGMGQPFADLRGFRAARLHRELGLNLAFPVMPLHGPRRDGFPFGVGFPSDELLDTVHGVAQAVWDTRRLISWIRSQGDVAVGLKGLSLGGYTTAVLAGVEDDLACVIAGIPAVDFAALFERHAPARFRRLPRYAALSEMARQVHRVVSPLALPARVPYERRYIYAGVADRLVDPREQVRALWTHWERPRIAWFAGSHVGFFWSQRVRTFVEDALAESGLVGKAGPLGTLVPGLPALPAPVSAQ